MFAELEGAAMRLGRYGLAASAIGAGLGTIVLPASPASAHQNTVASPAAVGNASVTGSNHTQYRVCVFNNVHTVRGEFRLVNGQTITRTFRSSNRLGSCTQWASAGGTTIVRQRACDPSGCSAWKTVR